MERQKTNCYSHRQCTKENRITRKKLPEELPLQVVSEVKLQFGCNIHLLLNFLPKLSVIGNKLCEPATDRA